MSLARAARRRAGGAVSDGDVAHALVPRESFGAALQYFTGRGEPGHGSRTS
jgi:hypothetical protein